MSRTEKQDYRALLKKSLLKLDELQSKVHTLEQAKTEPIAIIGMGCRFPGGCENPDTFWTLLQQGRDAISEIPTERWDLDKFYDPDPNVPGKMSTRYAGLVDHVKDFDASFFGVSPREAISLDPQHRLLLEVTWEAIEHATLTPQALSLSSTGVFVGICSVDYTHHLLSDGVEHIDAYLGTGNTHSTAAGRLSHFLGLTGPCLSVDTACSSSLVALHLACASLRNHESDAALAAGVNCLLSPVGAINFSKARMLSADGRCKTFDMSADGYVRSEGCGVVLLKRLSDARRDGDPILALVRGSAINQDGHTSGLTVPNGPSQQAVIHQALQAAQTTPTQISYVEAHGTGTSLGDPIEVGALGEVFKFSHNAENPLIIGAVKTNLGHSEGAAGIAGLIKVVLQLQHQEIAPNLHLHQPNPYIDWDTLPIQVPTQQLPWLRGKDSRVAGLSSFGFSGTNAHVILEEAPVIESPLAQLEPPMHLLTLSAKTPAALIQLVQRYQHYLEKSLDVDIADICFSSNVGRVHFEKRLALTADTPTQLLEQLRGETLGNQSYTFEARGREIGMLFTGQGAQYLGMGQELYQTQPTFKRTLDQCAELLRPYLDRSLLEILYAPDQSQGHMLDQTAYTQPILFAIEYALYQLWRTWGVQPAVVMGHSVGEYVAACAAGVFSLEDGLKLIATRGRLMQQLPMGGTMVAAMASEGEIRDAIADWPEVAIAAINGPTNIVISGTSTDVQAVVTKLESQNIRTRPLKVSHGFHSQLMQPMLAEFKNTAHQITYHLPQIPLVSNVTGQMVTTEVLTPDYWCRHILSPVNFTAGIETLHQQGCDIFLECGPKPTLLNMGQQCLPMKVGVWLPSLNPVRSDWQQMLTSLKALYQLGINLNWAGVHQDYPQRRKVVLPTYPFQRKCYWPTPEESTESTPKAPINMTNHGPVSPVSSPGNGQLMANNKHHWQHNDLHQEHRKDRILETLKSLIGGVMRMSPDDVDVHQSLLEAGADSIILMEAGQQLERTFGVSLSIRQLFEELNTLDALASYLDQVVAPDSHWDSSVGPLVNSSISNTPNPELASSEIPSHSPAPGIYQGDTALASSSGLSSASSSGLSSSLMQQHYQLMQQQLHSHAQMVQQQLQLSQQLLAMEQRATPPSLSINSSSPEEGIPATSVTAPAPPSPRTEPPQPQSSHPQTRSAQNWEDEKLQTRDLTHQQQKYVQQFIQRYIQRTPLSKQRAQAYRGVLADRRTSVGFRNETKEILYPIVGDRFQGARFWDVDGNEYVDLSMGFGSHLFGHQAPFIQEAVQQQLQLGTQTGPQSQLAGEVATLISELTGMERVCFATTGTDAVMAALRIARAATGRQKVVIFNGAYHGHFDGVLGIPEIQNNGDWQTVPMVSGILPTMVQDLLVLAYDSPRSLEIIKSQAHELAAVLVEPVQSRRPNLQPRDFLQRLREITQASGTALIFDDVLTGFRIHPGGTQAWFGVEADLATFGKVVGGGMPIGVFAGKAKFLDVIDGGYWSYGDQSYPEVETTFFGGTFLKHPFAMAAAKAVLQKLQKEGETLLQTLNQRTAQLIEKINAICLQEQVPIRVVHFGSLFRFTIANNSSYLFQPLELDLFAYNLIANGVYMWEGRSCFLCVSTTEADIQTILTAVKRSITDLKAGGFFPPESSTASENPSYKTNQVIVTTNGASALETTTETVTHTVPTTSTTSGTARLAQPEATLADGTNSSDTASLQTNVFPLTPAQTQLWILSQIEQQGSIAYNASVALQLQGPLDKRAVTVALEKIIIRHETLRTTITTDGKHQQVWPHLPADFEQLDLSHLSSGEQANKITNWLEQQSQVPFVLTQDSPLRVKLLTLAEQRYILTFESHHIFTDGWSMGVLLHEFGQLYSAACKGLASQLAPTMQFRQYSAHKNQRQQSPEMAIHEAFWLKQFADTVPVLELPTDRVRPARKTYAGRRQTALLGAQRRHALKQLGQTQGCSLFMVLLSVYTTFLHRLAGQDDILVGITGAGRSLSGSENLIGYCSSILPIRTGLTPEQTFIDHLKATRSILLEAYEHQDYPFAQLLEKLDLPWDSSRSALLNATFNLEPVSQLPEFLGLDVSFMPKPLSFMHYDLHFNIIDGKDELILEIDYSKDLFDDATISRWLGYFQTLLDGIITDPVQAIDQLPLLTSQEHHQILHEWNSTTITYPQEHCIHQLFAAQAQQTPDSTALIFDGERTEILTYQQLDERSNQLAHHLQSQGVGTDTLVGICVERSVDMVVGLLGILKAGGAYVPIDPNYPADRISFIVTDAQVPILLTQNTVKKTLPAASATKVMCLDDPNAMEVISKEPIHTVATSTQPNNLAYVIYTSGSTGQPKGVMNKHQAVCNRLLWMQATYKLTITDRVLQKTPFSFDVSVWEFFWPLIMGACLVVARPEGHKEPAYLINLIQQQQITTLHFVPPMLQIFLEECNTSNCKSMKRVFCSGESLPVELKDRFFRNFSCELHNLYGPTEAAIDVSAWSCKPNDGLSTVPIGYPIANTQLHILDKLRIPVPVGVAGELYIGGIQVAQGYLNRPELTAEKFIANPFGEGRLYKTGDLARYRPDGAIEFLGRLDHQVKIRGFRIELGEIEALLMTHEQIREAIVLTQPDTANEQQLVAYVVAQKIAPTWTTLRDFLKQTLPAYMVPAAFVLLESLPLTPNGKINRKVLPTPDWSQQSISPYVAPRNDIEQKVAEIWQELLGFSKVSVEDNFFELGGHSLRAVQLASRVSEAFDLVLPASRVLEAPTVSAQAQLVAAIHWVNGSNFDTSTERETGEL